MVAVVYADMNGVTERTVLDTDMLELMTSLRKRQAGWELQEFTRIEKRWFRKPVEVKSYTLYWFACCEWQVINTVAGFKCSKNEMGNLLLGLRMGKDK